MSTATSKSSEDKEAADMPRSLGNASAKKSNNSAFVEHRRNAIAWFSSDPQRRACKY
jgi:hypothetical protein